MNDFYQILEEKKKKVWQEIEKYLEVFGEIPNYCSLSKKYKKILDLHLKIIGDYPKRKGKYLRPALVLLTASAMGFPEKKAIKTASAMQVSEDWILNHDDVEDDSLMRRGKPTLHRIYGKELAINAGDGLHILMWKILRDNEKVIGYSKTFEIIDEFFLMLNRTVLGQTMEIYWTQKNKIDLADEDILAIMEGKTAYYTIAGPMRLGAILAGANKEQLDKLYYFGKLLGYAFQIKDDLLDLTSDFAGLKKQIGNDIYEGKRTIMLAHLLRNIKNKKEKQKLVSILKKNRQEKNFFEIKWVIEKMKEYGSLKYGEEMLETYLSQAAVFFEKNLDFLKYQPARNSLKMFISFLSVRKY